MPEQEENEVEKTLEANINNNVVSEALNRWNPSGTSFVEEPPHVAARSADEDFPEDRVGVSAILQGIRKTPPRIRH